MPDDISLVPTRLRRRFPHPLRGTPVAQRYRRVRRWLDATMLARSHNTRLAKDAPTLNFYPYRPHHKTQVVRILRLLETRIGFDPCAGGPVMLWDQGAWFDPRHAARLPAGTINGRCLDVSKSTVERAFAQAAGYELAVDPLTYEGPMIAKSELNGFHDGAVVHGPLAQRRAGTVYERLVDATEGDILVTVRTPIVGRRIPVTMVKWRNRRNFFSGYALTEPRPTDEVFSADEIDMLLRFAELIGLDYGELDVMRDRHSGLVYVVDANRTPMRNPWLDSRHDDAIYPPMADAFRELLVR
jgi:hypothetical protein